MNETPLSSIMKRFLRIVITLIFAGIGYQLSRTFLGFEYLRTIVSVNPVFTYVFFIFVSA